MKRFSTMEGENMGYGSQDCKAGVDGMLLRPSEGGGMAFTASEPIRKTPEILERVESLTVNIDTMVTELNALEERLTAVLVPDAPTTRTETAPTTTVTPLGERLRQLTDEIRMVANRIKNIRMRCQL